MSGLSQPQYYAIVAAVFLGFLVLTQRKLILTPSCIGVFILTHFVFVLFGLLALPFVASDVTRWFSAFAVGRLGDEEMALAIVLATAGIAIVYVSYHAAYLVILRGRILVRGRSLLAPEPTPATGYALLPLAALSLFALLGAIGYCLLNAGVFLEGLRAILSRRPDLIFAARRASTSNYLYVVTVYNVLPFFAVGLWLYASVSKRWWLYSRVYALATAVLLVGVFQKRPLILFLGALLCAHVWVKASADQRKGAFWAGLRGNMRVGLGVTAMFIVLVGLYFSSTRFGQSGGGALDTAGELTQVAALRVVGRLSLPSVMYAHYFPDIHPHYGISNIGLLAKASGSELYADTREVFSYFSAREGGSVAVPALFDFYGAFGLYGWLAGAVFLGFLLALTDAFLRSLPRTVANVHFSIFVMLSVFYLSQASLARTLMGYGAVFFVGLWVLTVRRSPRYVTSYAIPHADF